MKHTFSLAENERLSLSLDVCYRSAVWDFGGSIWAATVVEAVSGISLCGVVLHG